MKKIVAAAILAGVSLIAQAANNSIGGYWVDNIIPNSWAVQNTLMQSLTGANYSCGPTSLLFVSNHYKRLDTGQNSPNMSTVAASRQTLADMYTYIGVPYNSSAGTSLDNMKYIARYKFGWTNVARMYGDGSVSVAQNMDKLIGYFDRNIPALGVIRAGSAGNPVGNFNHIVVLYAYNKRTDEQGRAPLDPANTHNLDTIDWYEPYYGRQSTVLRKDAGTKFDMAYFSFLAVGRWLWDKKNFTSCEELAPHIFSKNSQTYDKTN